MYKIECMDCGKWVAPKAINKAMGVCGRCVQRGRDQVKGYGTFQHVTAYTCGLCGEAAGDSTVMSLVVEGRLQPVDYDCLLAQAATYPEAAAYAQKWLGELRAVHEREDELATVE